ncbi:cadherin-12 [Pimephales promelas]|uniref:cadherin-12 n=1 Tax=Pimephales promelas TaxID=90988 RepID=UPI001955D21F|nr:cadherin-12 [Pimephales promelas]XP_039521236.1 cadherin-12 [Pimephales promelas]KAG1955249.1 cadherin-18 [Pimephales promelas]KAG1955250.1 cadherin-18 [Pimephales promelas]KAG1955251.1 cadherin-18 [Pimephales promelas]
MLRRNCLLLFLCFLFEQSSCAPFQSRPGQEWSHSQTGPSAAGTHGGSRGFQRVKRGWVWNQFFVLEEYMGSDPQYVGKLHTDLDKGDSGVKYTLSGDGAGTIFTIDQTTGDIHALRSLDREEKPYYTLRAQAVDIDTNRPLEPESEFVIKVQDINDNEPKFLEGPYMASVPEMSPVGTYVMKVTATDADDPTYGNSARVVYSILHGQPYFSVDPKTGVIRTALPNMDREVKELYQVLIQAKDMGGQLGGLAGTTTINITLSDVNDNPPRFSKSIFHLRVPESSAVGSAVGRIKAHDLDIGKNAEVEYNIVPGDGGAMFDITTNEHNQEGIIMLKRPLDYETKKAYTFKVEASNAHLDQRFHSFGPFKDTATVKINVLDVDEPPVFSKPSYTMDVYEDTPQATIIGAVTAQDLDAGNSPVRYSIDWKSDLDSFFDIDPVRGTISTNELLDRESIAQHNISVVATKVNNPVLTSRVAVTVHVLDINEFPPELAMPYETFVCESAKAGQVVQVISATDQDLPQAGQRFSFKSPQEGVKTKNFTIRDFGNNTAGVVALRSGFKRWSQEIYHLPVLIEDGGLQTLSSTSTLTIRVCGCDTEGSLLTCSAEAIFLPVGLSTGALIAILVCIVILLVIVVLYVGVRRQKKKETLMTSKEDIRDNVIHYDDEGGGEEDTHAFDMGTLRNPKVIKENLFRRDVKPELGLCPQRPIASQNSADISNFISQRLQEHDGDTSAPPYDSLATYAYEGEGSVAESLSSIESVKGETEEDYDYLNEWGPRFKTLAGIFGERSESQSDVTSSTVTENKH